MAEEEIYMVIEEIKKLPIPDSEKIRTLQAWGREHKVEIKDEHIRKLLE
jgi:hypothetical protein